MFSFGFKKLSIEDHFEFGLPESSDPFADIEIDVSKEAVRTGVLASWIPEEFEKSGFSSNFAEGSVSVGFSGGFSGSGSISGSLSAGVSDSGLLYSDASIDFFGF